MKNIKICFKAGTLGFMLEISSLANLINLVSLVETPPQKILKCFSLY